MSYIFISYSHKDKNYVHRLQKALQDEGFDVWIDDRIDYGTEWPKIIQQQLDACGAFIVVVTENAFESQWVQNEVARANRKRKPFFPLLLEGDPWLSVEATQYVDVRNGSLPSEKFYQRLALTVPIRKSSLSSTEKHYSHELQGVFRFPQLQRKDKELKISPKHQTQKKSTVMDVILISALIIGIAVLIVLGIQMYPQIRNLPLSSISSSFPPTFTSTPPFDNATGKTSPVGGTLVPLAELLEAPHTPTPLYVNTPREPQSIDNYRAVKAAYEKQDWNSVISGMREIARSEPNAADPYYYIGEAYRFKGDFRNALEAYNEALRIDPDFGPPYLGLARARLLQNPNASIDGLYDEAIKHDPNFGEIYLDRALYYLNRQEYDQALSDLAIAERLLPGSPLVYYYQARTYLVLDSLDKAKTAALKAKEVDPTMLSAYYTLGEIYMAQEQYADAIEVLQTYVAYDTLNATARAMIGEAYYRAGDCESAIEALSATISMDTRERQSYLYRGLCYVEVGKADAAVSDLERASSDEFEPNLALMRAYMFLEHFGDAYLQGEKILSLAETDEELALAYYWRALNFEKREEPENAAESWQELLALPRSIMIAEMRSEAESHFYAIYTPTLAP